MAIIEVKTSAQLKAALKKGAIAKLLKGVFDLETSGTEAPEIIVTAEAEFTLVAGGSSQPRVEARESSQPRVVAWESSQPVTYTLPSESGGSLRGAGFRNTAVTDGGTWSRPSRGRIDQHPTEPKTRWEVAA